MVLEKVADLRYGENPHAARGLLPRNDPPGRHPRRCRADSRASRPSFNDLLDLDAAYADRDATSRRRRLRSSSTPIRSASPPHDELVEAYRKALETDSVSCFGGIVGVNRELDGATAREIAANSYEAVVAPVVQPRPRSASSPRSPSCALLAVPPEPDRRPARLRHRQPRLQAHRRRPPGRDARTSWGSTRRSSRS